MVCDRCDNAVLRAKCNALSPANEGIAFGIYGMSEEWILFGLLLRQTSRHPYTPTIALQLKDS